MRILKGRCWLVVIVLSGVSPILALGQSPRLTAPKLFPNDTLAYVRVDDASQLRKDFEQTSLGRLGNDAQLKPILTEFYGSLVRNTAEMQERIGLNLDELLSVPSGELAIALLPSDRNAARAERRSEEGSTSINVRAEVPALAILLDAGDEISSVELLLDRMEEAAAGNLIYSKKEFGPLILHRYSNPNRQRERFAYFIDDGVLVGCSDPIYLEQMAELWIGQAPARETLADNHDFTAIMSRCLGIDGERPQVSFYGDPLAIVRQFAPKTTSTRMALAVLPALGLDGIKAVGGSWIVAPDSFDGITHFHVRLSSPRRSILGLLRPKAGSTTPESWVPDTVVSYSTINWDLLSTLEGVERLYDQFRGPDAFQSEVIDGVSNRLEIDFRKDVLENLDGRLTMLQGIVRPVTINSGSNVYGLKFKDPRVIESKVLPAVISLLEHRSEVAEERFGTLQVRVFKPQGGRQPADAPIRAPEICFALYEDYLLIGDSRFMMRQVSGLISGSGIPLVDALEYQLIADRIAAQLQDRQSAAITYSRPDESLQVFYELARDPKNRERLRSMSENNGAFKALLSALEKHELPPFSVVSKYLAPSGGYLVEEEQGLHYMAFTLRRD